MCLSSPFTRQGKKVSCKGPELFLILQEQGTQKTPHSAGRSVEPEQAQAPWWVPQLLPELSVCLAVQDPKFEGLDLSYVSASFSWGTVGFISLNLTFFHL